MSRTATKAQDPVTDIVLDKGTVAVIENAQDALTIEEQQMQAHVRAVALRVRVRVRVWQPAHFFERGKPTLWRGLVECELPVQQWSVRLKYPASGR